MASADKYIKLFEYFRQCPELSDLWSIGATEDRGVRVILPQTTSSTYQYADRIDVIGGYTCVITPYPTIYEDFRINCYMWYDGMDNEEPNKNANILSFKQALSVCEWIEEQNNTGNFPNIGEQVVAIECTPFIPQIQYVNEDENTIGYYITVRVRYVNKRKPKRVSY